MLRLIRWLIGLALTLAVAIPILVLLLAVESDPLVPVQQQTDPQTIALARTLLQRYDPRADPSPGTRTIELSRSDLLALIQFVLGRLGPAGASVELADGRATLVASIAVPDSPLGRYLNLRLDLVQAPGGLELDGVSLGRLQAPAPIAHWLGRQARRLLRNQPIYGDIADTLVATRISPAGLVLRYRWQPGLVDRVKSEGAALLTSPEDRERLLAQAERIASFSRDRAASREVSVAKLLGSSFALARERTRDPADAAAENRAALIALGLYVRGVDIPGLLGVDADTHYEIRPLRLELAGREDLAQHLLISAGMAATAGSTLADAVGLGKELDDSRGGSGFSFTDLAADRSGVRLAESATGPQAAEVQAMLAGQPSEALFLPKVTDLPEFMPEAEFTERFGGVGAPAYEQMTSEIEERISALAVHRRR